MSKVAISEEYLTDIADSIREKLGSQDTYKVSEMSEAIDSITGGGGDVDWSAIGYESTPQAIVDNYNYALQIKNNWDASTTSLQSKFASDTTLVIMPLIDTSNVLTMQNAFQSCSNLSSLPILDTSKLSYNTSFRGMFRYTNSSSLSNESLDNLLQMCINATSYNGTKTLSEAGFTSSWYPASRIQALPHYQDFITAGWTIGYN